MHCWSQKSLFRLKTIRNPPPGEDSQGLFLSFSPPISPWKTASLLPQPPFLLIFSTELSTKNCNSSTSSFINEGFNGGWEKIGPFYFICREFVIKLFFLFFISLQIFIIVIKLWGQIFIIVIKLWDQRTKAKGKNWRSNIDMRKNRVLNVDMKLLWILSSVLS